MTSTERQMNPEEEKKQQEKAKKIAEREKFDQKARRLLFEFPGKSNKTGMMVTRPENVDGMLLQIARTTMVIEGNHSGIDTTTTLQEIKKGEKEEEEINYFSISVFQPSPANTADKLNTTAQNRENGLGTLEDIIDANEKMELLHQALLASAPANLTP